MVDGPPMEPGPSLPFPSGPHDTLHLPFSEADMLHRSLGADRDVAVYAGVVPGFLRAVFLAAPAPLLNNPLSKALMWLEFSVLRRLLLSWRSSEVEMVACATPAGGEPVRVGLVAPDGMGAAGFAAAAMVEGLLAADPGPGLHMPDEVLALAPTVEATRRLAGEEGALRMV